jgi:small subunit ribosomal protein S20
VAFLRPIAANGVLLYQASRQINSTLHLQLHIKEDKALANSPQARKRARQTVARRALKIGQRSTVRTSIKKVIAAIESGNKDEAQAAYTAAVSVIDRYADKGVIHKNKAARHKSRLNAHVKAMA